MILDSGLDNAAAFTAGGYNSAAFDTWIRYACYGTGSTAPSAGDTSLANQAGSRTNDAGGFGVSVDGGRDGVNNVLWLEVTNTRVFAISGNVNATEWGLAPQPTGDLSVRELFRADPNDNSSSPITLTLESGDELQLVYTLRLEAVWEYANTSFVITGTAGNDTNGTHDGKHTATTGTGTTVANIRNALASFWPGGSGGSGLGGAGNLQWSNSSSASSASKSDNVAAGGYFNGVVGGYTPGNFYRDFTYTAATSQANGTHYAWTVSSYGGANEGFRFVLLNPSSLVKAGTHKLTLTVRRTISRL